MLSDRLTRIARSFGARADQYDRHASLQKDAAAMLAQYLPLLEAPSVLEVGCGTGFVTGHLLAAYPDGRFVVTDIAPEMISQCAAKYPHPAITYAVMDGQAVPQDSRYDVIALGMAAQWFDDPVTTLMQWRACLKPGGVLVYSAPGPHSFAPWAKTLADMGLKNGLLTYPAWPHIVHTEMIDVDYGRVENFLKNLKDIGAYQPREGATSLHPAALRKACRLYNQQHGGYVQWEIVYGVLQAAA